MTTPESEPVDFIIIGAAKSGTTSIYNYLKLHPKICMSKVKETNFFVFESKHLDFAGPGDNTSAIRQSITSLEDYESSFQPCEEKEIRGEASPKYLYFPDAPYNIKRQAPSAKLITILRNPVDRAYSAYMHLRRDLREPYANFAEALNAEEERISQGYDDIWYYVSLGYYGAQLKRYYDVFPDEQILVLFYENLCQDRNGTLDKIYRFLNLETGYFPKSDLRHNQGGEAKSKRLRNLFYHVLQKDNWFRTIMRKLFPESFRTKIATRLRLFEAKINLKKYDKISSKDRYFLIDLYRTDIEELQQLTGKDLTHWLK